MTRQVHFVESIKWLENQPFGRHDYDALVRDMLAVPGTPRVAVSRCGVTDVLPLTAHWGAMSRYDRASSHPCRHAYSSMGR